MFKEIKKFMVPLSLLPSDEEIMDNSKKDLQRKFRKSNYLAIMDSIKKKGWHPAQIIVINEKYEIVDGQHRIVAARACGMKEVPCVMLAYDSIKEQKEDFLDISLLQYKISQDDVLKLSEQPYPNLYRYLTTNKSSYISSKNEFTTRASNIHRIISYAGLGVTYVYTIRRQTGIDAISEKANKELVLLKVNNYIDWLVTIFATYHSNEKINMMKVRNFEALSHFYLLLKNQGLEKKAISKMSRFYNNSVYKRFLEAGLISSKVEILVSLFNKGRSNYLLSMDLKERARIY